jgi:hypothetical protein
MCPEEPLHSPPTPIESELVEEARSFAQSADLEPGRVLGLLERAAQLQDRHGREFHRTVLDALRGATKELPARYVLEVFEREELGPLMLRLSVPMDLASAETPLYTIEEMTDLLRAFRGFLVANEEALLESGYVEGGFTESPWLNRHLGKLYYLEAPAWLAPRPGDGRSVRDHNTWEMRDLAGQRDHDKQTRRLKLDSADAAQLVRGRARVHKIKLEVLSRLEKAMREGAVSGAWKDFEAIITGALSSFDADFYLRMDRFYRDEDDARRVDFFPTPNFLVSSTLPGGLSDLLEVVGHCELELRFRWLDRTKRSLLELAKRAGVNDWRELVASPYLVLVEKPWRDGLDQVLDGYLKLGIAANCSDFWPAFRQRVTTTFEMKFDREVVYRGSFRADLKEPFERHLVTYAEWALGHLEMTGSLPVLELRSPETGRPPSGNQFSKNGGIWTITFAGQTTQLSDLRGLSYIAYLIEHQDREVASQELVLFAGPGRREGVGGAHNTGDEEQLASEGLTITDVGDAGPRLTREAAIRLRAQRRELSAELEEAGRLHDPARKERIERDIAAIDEWIKKSLGLGGRERKDSDTRGRARSAVGNAINRSLERIKPLHEPLWRHLHVALHLGDMCSYRPEYLTHWQT